MRSGWLMFGVGLPFVVALAAPTLRAQWRTHWSYVGADGPAHWGDLDTAYAACKVGKQQSPIDIRSAVHDDLPALRFEYKASPLAIINNGYTAVRVDYPKGNGNFLVIGGKRYELTQFHFHHPSEECIDGKPFAMEVHLMHTAADGSVAAVAVMLQEGSANPSVQVLWRHMPLAAGPAENIAGVELNPAGLLPSDTSYYRYAGSQTAPPCTEGVTWFVLRTPVEVSAAQIQAFARLYPHDVRPLQPLNGRVVQASR